MRLSLRQVEPANIPPVGNVHAANFMRHLTGGEQFEFTGSDFPRALLLYEMNYAYPQHSYARGYLLSTSLDRFHREARQYETMQPVMSRYVIGWLKIEIGGHLTSANVTAGPLDLTSPELGRGPEREGAHVCGFRNPPGSRFCAGCGARLQ